MGAAPEYGGGGMGWKKVCMLVVVSAVAFVLMHAISSNSVGQHLQSLVSASFAHPERAVHFRDMAPSTSDFNKKEARRAERVKPDSQWWQTNDGLWDKYASGDDAKENLGRAVRNDDR